MTNKMISSFINELRKNKVSINESEIEQLLLPLKSKTIIHKSPKKMIEKIIEESSPRILELTQLSPGFTIKIKTNSINIKLFGGVKDYDQNKITPTTIFDLASITKQYTQLIIYKLIESNAISFETKIHDILPNFPNLGNITIGDITSFMVEFKTDGRIDETTSIEEAKSKLESAYPVAIGKYNYNDIGSMILKEVAEKVTNKSYIELVNEITSKINANNTFVLVPFEKRHDITGTPNVHICRPNDAKANALGGYSGHAGMWSNADDLIVMAEHTIKNTIVKSKDFITHGIDSDHAVAGNTLLKNSYFIDPRFPSTSIAFQGSTRTQLNSSRWNLDKSYFTTHTILLNPATKPLNEIKRIQYELNKQGYDINLIQTFKSKQYDEKIEYTQIDARYLIPVSSVMVPMNRQISDMIIKLLFIEYMNSKYEKTNFDYKVEKQLTM